MRFSILFYLMDLKDKYIALYKRLRDYQNALLICKNQTFQILILQFYECLNHIILLIFMNSRNKEKFTRKKSCFKHTL